MAHFVKQHHVSHGLWIALPQDAYFLDNALKGVPTSVSKTAGSYRVVKNMNRRTAEQGTVEYRSEKYFLILF